MELFIVRHGRPAEQRGAVGGADPELTELGHEQAQAVGEYLSTQSIDAIYSSPMRRAYQTAEPLARLLAMDITVVDDLKESDYQSDEYLPAEENRDELIAQFRDNPDFVFGADGREVFFNRVNEAFRSIVDANSGKNVAVFCHGMVTGAFVTTILGIDDPHRLSPDYTGLTRVQASTKHEIWTLRSLNETMHLRELPDVRF